MRFLPLALALLATMPAVAHASAQEGCASMECCKKNDCCKKAATEAEQAAVDAHAGHPDHGHHNEAEPKN